MKKRNPTAGIGELGKLMGEMWSKLSEKEKAPYQKRADKDKERYNQEKEAYVPPTPPMPKDWAEATDPNTGKTYYYNRKTSETTWTRPEAPPEKPKKKKARVAHRYAALCCPARTRLLTPEQYNHACARAEGSGRPEKGQERCVALPCTALALLDSDAIC